MKLSTMVLFAADPHATADFYARVLGLAPVPALSTPDFAALNFGGVFLGLQRATAAHPAGVGKIGVEVEDVDQTHAEWAARGAQKLGPVMDMPLFRSFVAHDPEGNGIRVMRMKAARAA